MEFDCPIRVSVMISEKWRTKEINIDPDRVYSYCYTKEELGYTFYFIEELQQWKPSYLFIKFDLCLN